MLHIAPLHVRKEKLENPVLTLPPGLAAIYALESGGIRDALDWAASFVPMATGKHTSTRELSNNGVFTYGRLEAATSALGRARIDSVVTTLAKAIDTWRRISAGATQPPVTPGK